MDTMEQVIELKKLGIKNCEIARKLGVSRQYVSRICRSHGYGREPLPYVSNYGKSNGKKLITTAAASHMLGVSEGTIRRWADDGKIPCFRIEIGRRDRRFYQSDIESLITRMEKQ
jgi:excisionase family DNA binding protein